MSTSDAIDIDLPCARCGYNLRTRPRDGVCPECGDSVSASVDAFARLHEKYLAIRRRGVAWMTTIRTGVLLALAAWILFVSTSMPSLGRRAPSGGVDAVVAVLPSTTSLVVFFWGMWRWFAPGRTGPLRLARAVLVIALASFIASRFDSYWIRYYFGRDAALPRSIEPWFYGALQSLAATLWLALPAALAIAFARYAQLCWLARRRVLMAHAAIVVLVAALWPIDPWPRRFAMVLGVRWGQVVDMGSAMLLFSLPVSFAALAYTLTRAIRLGGLPEASSRSSPSPRPPT